MTVLLAGLRNLAYWQPRNLGALLGITIAIASLVALVGLARGVQETLLSALENRGTDVMVTEAGVLDLISSIVPETLAPDLAVAPGVVAVAPELARLTTLADGRSVAVVAWPAGSFPWESLTLTEGRLPGADEGPGSGEGHVVVLGESLARRMQAGIGDRITLFHAPFEVVGLVTSPALLSRSAAYARLEDVQALTFREGQATSFNIQTAPGRAEAAAKAIGARFPDLSVETSAALADGYLFGRIANILAFAISSVALVSSVLVIFNTMSTAVNARRGEIAILSAVGWDRWRIVAMLLIEGSVISMIAGAAGIVAGTLMAQAVAGLPQVVGFVQPVIGAGLLATAFAVSVGVGLLGAFVPAVRAVRRPPADILRGH